MTMEVFYLNMGLGIPEKYLIDAQGRLVWKFVGPTESDVLKNKIDALLTEY